MRKLLAVCTAALLLVAGGACAADPVQTYSWRSVPFGAGGFVDGFLYHPKQKGLLYARTDIGGMYRYDYAAKAWVPLLDGLGHDDAQLIGVLSMAVDPNDPNKLYAATGEYYGQWAHMGAVMRSDDQGKSWQKTDLPIHLGANSDGRGTGDRLQVDPHDGQVLLLASSQDGLWKSSDGGATFAKIASPGARLSLVLFDPGHAGTIYAGSADGKGGLFRSTDDGMSFSKVDGTPDETPQHAVFDADSSLYVTFAAGDGKGVVNPSNATTGGVWKMTPDGKWSNISPVHPDPGGAAFGYSGVDVDAEHPGTVLVSTLDRWSPGDDIFRSTDGGAHWQALGALSRHDATGYPWMASYTQGVDKMGHWIADVRINPFNSDEAIYGTGYGLWMSENLSQAGGAAPVTWDFNVRNFEETATTGLTSPTGGAILLASFGDVGGAAWDDLSVSPGALFTPANESNFSVDYAGLNPSFVARTVANSANNGFYSEDGGASWNSFGATAYKRQDAQGGWHSAGTVAVSAKGTSMLWVPEKEDAVYSADKGRTWTKSQGWPAGRDMTLVPVADKAIDGVYYVFDRYAMAILISVDGGASFKPIVQGIPKIEGWQNEQLAVVPGRVRDLWLAAPYGLLHSEDENHPLAAVPGVDVAWKVAFGKSKTDGGYPAVYLYGQVKGQEGLFRSDDEGQTWTRINDDAHRFGGLDGMSGDMLDYGTLYIAPEGRGVMVGKP